MADLQKIYVKIGKRIQEIRNKKHLTQDRLATLVSLTRTSITNIEKGRQKFLIHTLYDFANSLGVDPKDLLPEETKQVRRTTGLKLPDDLSKDEINWVRSVVQERGSIGHSKKSH